MDYALQDFLLFSPQTYWRLFERVNADTWPLAVIAVAAGLAVCRALIRPGWMRAASALLAAGWLIAGFVFLWRYYVPVHWALWPAPWLAAALAAALAALAIRGAAARADRPALALALYGVVLHPLGAVVSGRPLAGAEVALIAPDPTAILTVAFAATLTDVRLRWALAALPLIWLVQSALTLHAMGAPGRWPVIAALLIGIILLLRRRGA